MLYYYTLLLSARQLLHLSSAATEGYLPVSGFAGLWQQNCWCYRWWECWAALYRLLLKFTSHYFIYVTYNKLNFSQQEVFRIHKNAERFLLEKSNAFPIYDLMNRKKIIELGYLFVWIERKKYWIADQKVKIQCTLPCFGCYPFVTFQDFVRLSLPHQTKFYCACALNATPVKIPCSQSLRCK